jgi:FKBP-type peptidyl-prolyl cis-trans isomerase FkpA
MKLRILILTLALALGATVSTAAEPALETDDQKTLYALGLAMARSLETFQLTPEEIAVVQAGLGDALAGREPRVALETWGPRIDGLLEGRAAVALEKERAAATSFVEAAAQEPGAERTPSGLVYTSIEPGTGEQPAETDTVRIHYTGSFRNGQVFDSSRAEGEPVTFPLNQVIPCFGEGVGRMKVGGKAKLVCPPELAYGDRGSPPVIPAGAALVFEIELLEIVKGEEAPPTPEPQNP